MKRYILGLGLVFFGFFGMIGGAASAQTIPVPSVQLSAPVPDFGTVSQVLAMTTDLIGTATTLVTKFAPEYWDIHVQQMKAESFLTQRLTLSFFLLSLGLALISSTIYFRAMMRHAVADERGDREPRENHEVRSNFYVEARKAKEVMDNAGPAAIIAGALLAISFILGSLIGGEAYLKGENPRYYAIQEILKQVK